MRSPVLIVLAAAVTAPATAAPAARIDVLGVHHGDAPAAVKQALSNAGLAQGLNYSGVTGCTESFADLVDRSVAQRFTAGSSCRQEWADPAGRRVVVMYYMTPAGFRVSSVDYTMPFTGTRDQFIAELQKKFGPPKGRFKTISGFLPTFSLGSDLTNRVFVRGYASGTTASVALAPDDVAQDMKAADAAIAAAAARRTGGDRLKL